MKPARQVLVPMSDAEYDWVLSYAQQRGITVDGAIRVAIRMHNMVELTPGAREAVLALQPKLHMLLPGDPLEA